MTLTLYVTHIFHPSELHAASACFTWVMPTFTCHAVRVRPAMIALLRVRRRVSARRIRFTVEHRARTYYASMSRLRLGSRNLAFLIQPKEGDVDNVRKGNMTRGS